MRLPKDTWDKIGNAVKNQLLAKYEPTSLPSFPKDRLLLDHKGFYVGLKNSANEELIRVGFMKESPTDILDSAFRVTQGLFNELQSQNIPLKFIRTSSFYCTLIWDVVFINNGLSWNENEDGIYFNWGDKYSGFYLPYQIQSMTATKVDIMNRLCSLEAKIPSNLWRLPEGLVHKLICDSYVL